MLTFQKRHSPKTADKSHSCTGHTPKTAPTNHIYNSSSFIILIWGGIAMQTMSLACQWLRLYPPLVPLHSPQGWMNFITHSVHPPFILFIKGYCLQKGHCTVNICLWLQDNISGRPQKGKILIETKQHYKKQRPTDYMFSVSLGCNVSYIPCWFLPIDLQWHWDLKRLSTQECITNKSSTLTFNNKT